jgi:hypothetical protein
MPRSRRPGGYCGAATIQGTQCMAHTDGGLCWAHRSGPAPELPRCGAPVGASSHCFKRVKAAGDRCRHHQPVPPAVELNAWLRRARKQLQALQETVEELIRLTEG